MAFEKHVMYSRAGESKMANTKKQHLALKKKGWSNVKPKSSALKVNERLISQSSETFKYSGGDGSSTSGEFGNLTDKVAKEIMSDRMNSEESSKKETPKKEKEVKKTKIKKKNETKKPVDIDGDKEPKKHILNMESMELELNPDWVEWNELYGNGSGPPMKGSPMRSQSQFRGASALKSRTRERYLPSNNVSPVKQTNSRDLVNVMGSEPVGMGRTLPEIDIWSTFEKLPEEDLKEMVKDHVENTNYKTGDELIKAFQNPKHKIAVKNYFKEVKENIVNAMKDNNPDIKNQWMENARNLIDNMGMLGEKYGTWSDINKVNPFENSDFSSAISKSSHKGDMRKYDLTYLGSDQINMSIAEEGDIYFKMQGIDDDIWTVKDLDKNVRLKNFQGYKIWDGFIQDIKKTVKEGGEVSNTALEGVVNSLTESKDSALSFFFDFGLFDQFEKQIQEQGGEVNTDTLMPESTNFNMDIVTDLVKNGLINMAKQTMSSAIAAGSVSKASTSAKSLLRKYSK